jgi:hypothetical protein
VTACICANVLLLPHPGEDIAGVFHNLEVGKPAPETDSVMCLQCKIRVPSDEHEVDVVRVCVYTHRFAMCTHPNVSSASGPLLWFSRCTHRPSQNGGFPAEQAGRHGQ